MRSQDTDAHDTPASDPDRSAADEQLPRIEPAEHEQHEEPEEQEEHEEPDDPPPPARPEPTPREWAALARLRSSHNWIDRVHALSDLLKGEPRLAYAVFRPPFSDHAEVDDPDLRCFLLATELSRQLGARLPEVLVPYLERGDLDPASRSRLESALAEHVEAWVGSAGAARARSLRLEFGIGHGTGGEPAVILRARVDSLRLDDQPRTGGQLRQLLADAKREPGLLPADQQELLELLFEPLVAPCLREHDARFVLTGSALLRVLLAVQDSPRARWSRALDPEVGESVGLRAGGPLVLAAGSVRIGPVLADTESGPRVVLEHRLPDGRVLAPAECLVLRGAAEQRREPTLVLAEGHFWTTRGDPPAPLPELFASSGGFDPSTERARPLVTRMARAFGGFRASLADHARVHPVRALVSLELRDDDWLHLRAFAAASPSWAPGEPAPSGAPVFEWTPDGRWERLGAEPSDAADPTEGDSDAARSAAGAQADSAASADVRAPADLAPVALPDEPEPPQAPPAPSAADEPAGDVWLEYPDPARTEPLGAWLETLGVAPADAPRRGGPPPEAADRERGGWLPLDARSAEHLAAAWEARPPGTAWYGNAAARRLLERPRAAAPKLRVSASGVDWFSLSAEWEAEGASLSDDELAALRRAEGRFVRLESGWVRRDEAQAQERQAELLAELGLEAGDEPQRLGLWQLARARPEALALLEELGAGSADADLAALRERIANFAGLPRVPVPEGIEGTLRPYQREGLDFLVHASELGLGAILADDMGLGKTLQALAWLARLVEQDPGGGPTLVVCPASVLHNWEREAARFAPKLRVLPLTAGEERHALRETVPAHDLVLTTYALLRRDREELGAVEWRAVVLDEAQNIKNPDAAVSRAARGLTARHRLALTGTPLENRALDLWSIQAFLNPGYLGPRAPFVRRFDLADAPPHARTLLAARLRPVMLRRLKAQVAPELPPRIEEQRDCELTPGQRKLYLAELTRGRKLLGNLDEGGGLGRERISILALLTRLRQICCHPALVGGDPRLGSGKFDAFFELLEPLLAEGHKVLVFSQFVECLKLVAAALDEREIAYHMLTGSSRRRGDIVAAFENDPTPAPFLVSLKAGGTGLNLTAANYVVLFDPWWNPAVEAQAIDRTHRIGQDRTVIAYRMVAQGTIEERIQELQQRKAALVRDVLGEDGFAKALDRDDLHYLLAEF